MKFKKSLRKAKKSLSCIFGAHKSSRSRVRQSKEDDNDVENKATNNELGNGERSLSPRLSCIVRDEELVAYIEDESSKASSAKPTQPNRSTRPTMIAFDHVRSMKAMARSPRRTVAPESIAQNEEEPTTTTKTLFDAPTSPPILGNTTSEYSYVSSVTESLVTYKVKPSTEEKLRHIRTASLDNLNSAAVFQEEPIQFGSYNKLLSPASDAVTEDDPDPLTIDDLPTSGVAAALGGFGFQSPLPKSLSVASQSRSSKKKHDDDSKNPEADAPSHQTEVIPDENDEIEVHVVDSSSDGKSSKNSPSKRQNNASGFFQSLPGIGWSKSKSSRVDMGKSPLADKDTNISSDDNKNGEKRDAPYPEEEIDTKKPKVEGPPPDLVDEEYKTIRYDGWKKYGGDENVSFGNNVQIGWAQIGSQVLSFGNSTQVMGTHARDPTTEPRVLSPPLMESLQMLFPHSCSEDHFWLKYSLVRDGASLETALEQIKGSSRTVIAIETNDGEVFGSFTSVPWKIQPEFFGNGEAFLWRLKRSRLIDIPVNTSCDDQSVFASKLDRDIEVYPYSQLDTYVQKCTTSDGLIVGGGLWNDNDCPFEGEPKGIGLKIDPEFEHGSTGTCATFTNRALSKTSPMKFSITNLEIWTLTPFYPESQAKAAEDRFMFINKAQNSRRTQ